MCDYGRYFTVFPAALKLCPMRLNALLMCRDQQSLRILAAALEELGIEPEVCVSSAEAMERLVIGHYSALVLDFDLPAATHVARLARLAPPQRRPVIFAMIGVLTGIAGTFRAGANFVLYKPLAPDQLMRSLRAGRGFMKPDRRRSARERIQSLVYLQFGGATVPAIVLDLNQDGLAVQAPGPLPAAPEVPLRFLLPGTTHLVKGTGEILWADDSGRAGFYFAQLPAPSRKLLKNWLAQRSARKKTAARAPERAPRAGVSPAVSQ